MPSSEAIRPAAFARLDVVGREGERQVARIALDHPQCDVDLLELDAREPALADSARSGCTPTRTGRRPRLRAAAADVGVARRARRQVVGLDVARRLAAFADDVRQVVVAVDQRVRFQNFARLRKTASSARASAAPARPIRREDSAAAKAQVRDRPGNCVTDALGHPAVCRAAVAFRRQRWACRKIQAR